MSNFLGLSLNTNGQLFSLRYSYILFSNQVIVEKHDYIVGDFKLVNGEEYKFSSLSHMDLLLTGLNSFHIPRDRNYRFSLAYRSMFGQGYFSLQTPDPHLQTGFSYMAVEMIQKYVCEDCTDSPIIYENKFCVEACPRGFSITERLGNQYCDKCEI